MFGFSAQAPVQLAISDSLVPLCVVAWQMSYCTARPRELLDDALVSTSTVAIRKTPFSGVIKQYRKLSRFQESFPPTNFYGVIVNSNSSSTNV